MNQVRYGVLVAVDKILAVDTKLKRLNWTKEISHFLDLMIEEDYPIKKQQVKKKELPFVCA